MLYVNCLNHIVYLHFQQSGPIQFPWYFQETLNRTRLFYPNAVYHLLTNIKEKVPGFEVHVRPDLPINVQSKFHLFGLLEVPFVFLDMDVYLIRPFSSFTLSRSNDFSFFTWVPHWKKIQPPLSESFNRHYNSGIIWFNKPKECVKSELIKLGKNCFPFETNDDIVMSYYCFLNGIEFENKHGVNKLVYGKYEPDLKAQSLHFIGSDKSHLGSFLKAVKDAPRKLSIDSP